ncbi:MAG: DUF507 family protein [Nitrospiraceae bacterium]|jgi:hypothetical protein|nr:DUF507 family protein [Nitrospiraceae bacterium]OQW67385.1 MAG: hypothetical protein BVN29_03780 [Nitrospira sp. ST-bin5]
MRISKDRVHHMAESVVAHLQQDGQLDVTGDRKAFVESLEQVITTELGIEDLLNAEVRQMLKAYEKQIEQGQVDYQRMFTMIKTKLVRERGIIL